MTRLKSLRLASIAALAFTGSMPARADLTINANFDSSITTLSNAVAIEAAINAGIANVEANVSSPKNIKVSINFSSVSSGLGETTGTFYNVSYFDYYNALKANATSLTQLTAIASLGTAPTNENSVNPVTGTTKMFISAAEGRNLGFNTPGATPAAGGTYDAAIGLNTSITSPPNGLNGSTYNLQSVATHEIDEVLGIGGAGSSIGNSNAAGDLDLYRYSAPGVRSFTTSSSAISYFSIDGGVTALSYFNQVAGADYGDWQSDPTHAGFGPQVQDAFATPGAAPTLDGNELTAFTAIGYSLVSVPEPSSIALCGIAGIAGLGMVWKRRKRVG